jgi:hypothetical protein
MSAPQHFSLAHFWPISLLVLIVVAGMLVFGRGVVRSIGGIVYRCSVALGSFDAEVIDEAGAGSAGGLVRGISSISILADAWIVDGAVKVIAGIIWTLCFPVRMIQSGAMQSYLLLMVIGLIGFLGYYLYMGHHAIR